MAKGGHLRFSANTKRAHRGLALETPIDVEPPKAFGPVFAEELAHLVNERHTMKCSPKSITFAATILASCVICGTSAYAKDETAAVYVQGMGGSLSTNDGQSRGGLGLQAGAQLLFLEAYASQTAFANDATLDRSLFWVPASTPSRSPSNQSRTKASATGAPAQVCSCPGT